MVNTKTVPILKGIFLHVHFYGDLFTQFFLSRNLFELRKEANLIHRRIKMEI